MITFTGVPRVVVGLGYDVARYIDRVKDLQGSPNEHEGVDKMDVNETAASVVVQTPSFGVGGGRQRD